ncbi:hypothetical protein JCM17380_24300 [Desulfosporosinus burensis]
MCNEIFILDRKLKENGDSELFLTIPMEILKAALLGNLSGNEFKMFVAIASFMDDRGECSPSQETLSVLTGMAIATTNTAINALLKKRIGDSPILHRELVGKGSTKYSMYRIPKLNEENVLAAETANKPMTSPEVMKLFREKYQEKYNVPYKPDYRREMGMIKKSLLPNYTDEQIVVMIETVFDEFDKRWKQPQYPAPTIGAICSWLGGQALKLSADRVKAKTAVSKWDELENTDEDLML